MELKEGIAAIQAELAEKCDHKPDKSNWRCVLEGKTDSHLVTNITRDRNIPEPVWPPPNGSASIKNVVAHATPPVWPHQAHHLIPWKQLRKHPASQYLDKNKNVIWGDNDYSVNHGNNGLFMPYSAGLEEWNKTTDQQKLSDDLMDIVFVQLHQSRHSAKQYEGAEQGYKARVKSYLETISDNGLKHTDLCNPCKQNKKNALLPPRETIVRAVDRASKNLEQDLKDMDIFVSKRAAIWAQKRGL